MAKQSRVIVCRTMPFHVGYQVRTWMDTGWRFPTVRNRPLTRAILCHWTGAENVVGQMYRSMSERKNAFGKSEPLSVHFAVNQKGTVYQLADTEMRAAHCKGHGANGWSIGIEFVGRGSDLTRPQKGIVREQVVERIHGAPVRYDELLPAQIEAGVKLIESLCTLYALPMRVPEDARGNVVLEELPESVTTLYTGVLGHGHVEAKNDPGLGILRAVQARGKQMAGKLPVA